MSRLLQRKFGFEVETNIGLRNIADATFVKKNQPAWGKGGAEQKSITTHPDVTAEDAVGVGAAYFAVKVDHHRGHGVTDRGLKDYDLKSQNVLANPEQQADR